MFLLNSTFMIVLLSFLFNFVLKNVIAHEIQHVAMLLRCFDTWARLAIHFQRMDGYIMDEEMSYKGTSL